MNIFLHFLSKQKRYEKIYLYSLATLHAKRLLQIHLAESLTVTEPMGMLFGGGLPYHFRKIIKNESISVW